MSPEEEPMGLPSIAEHREPPFVSTGHLPDPDIVQSLVFDAHLRFKANKDGPELATQSGACPVPSDLFGICLVGTSGSVYGVVNASVRHYALTVMITAGLYETSGDWLSAALPAR